VRPCQYPGVFPAGKGPAGHEYRIVQGIREISIGTGRLDQRTVIPTYMWDTTYI